VASATRHSAPTRQTAQRPSCSRRNKSRRAVARVCHLRRSRRPRHSRCKYRRGYRWFPARLQRILITPRIVLTAAHCLGVLGERTTVQIGAHAVKAILRENTRRTVSIASRVNGSFDFPKEIGIDILKRWTRENQSSRLEHTGTLKRFFTSFTSTSRAGVKALWKRI
jgi:hypothetical protein